MKLYSYQLTLIDPLFFAIEGLNMNSAFTPVCIHATALNCAVLWCLGNKNKQNSGYQSYIMHDNSNEPKYENSLISNDFYYTPANPIDEIKYYSEIVKGEGDKYIQIKYGSTSKNKGIKILTKNEILKPYQIYFISPESRFCGYVYVKDDFKDKLPNIIRLGSFRSIAKLQYKECYNLRHYQNNKKVCSHLVDPLIIDVIRGQVVPMMPYPVIKKALVKDILYVNNNEVVAFIDNFKNDNIEPNIIKCQDKLMII